MSVDRLERLDSLLRRVIAEGMFRILQSGSVSPGLVTVTSVKCGRDMRDATVYVSVFGDDATKTAVLKRLQSKAREFQSLVNREVRMKFTPRLLFKLDLSLEKGDEVLAILDNLSSKDGPDGESDKT